MKNKEVAQYALKTLLAAGAEKAEVVYVEDKKYELNIAAGEITLLRTNINNSLVFKAIRKECIGTLALNSISKEAIDNGANEVITLCNSSPPDACHDISPKIENLNFKNGEEIPDLELMYDLLDLLAKKTKEKYPKTILEEVTFSFTHRKSWLQNSNGVEFFVEKGIYEVVSMFTSKDGKKTSSFNYTGCSFVDLKKDLIKRGDLEALLAQSSEQTKLTPFSGKFTGKIIVTPHCLPNFLGALTESLSDMSLISGSSPFKDKIGEKIAHHSFSLYSKPVGEELADKSYVSSDGYKGENCTIVENGFLRSFLLSQYGANKTGLARSKSQGENLVIPMGDKDLSEMIKSIGKGVLLCRFAGGHPGDSGEFSGVAKNSYYIENGEVKYPISETMISGNFISMFKEINGISKERVDFGSSVLPWIVFDGVTISG
ncbi:MAG: TldD/PmbA family protein [Bdellovibrionota bacterium]